MRRLPIIISLLLIFGLLQINTQYAQEEDIEINYELFVNHTFSSPVDIQYSSHLGGLLVIEQSGIVKLVKDQEVTIFLDLSDQVASGAEMGLLGLAIHPEFSTNGRFYLDYTVETPKRTIISQFNLGSDLLGNTSTEKIILEVEQPYANHNAGSILFADDGFLYISMGDGGSGGDPQNNGQNPSTLLGNILRLDVSNQSVPYSIPESNPFVDDPDYREEIYAYGLRNPWKMSYDTVLNSLIVADVGQNAIEEVNIVESGKNYGWNQMEGSSCFVNNCNTTNKELPFTEYNRTIGNSITGGYVNRNSTSSMYGMYLFGDFGSGMLLGYNMTDFNSDYIIIDDSDFLISTFGILPSGDILLCDYVDGKIYKLVFLNNQDSDSVEESGPTEIDTDLSESDVDLIESDTDEINLQFTIVGILVLVMLLRPFTTKLDFKK